VTIELEVEVGFALDSMRNPFPTAVDGLESLAPAGVQDPTWAAGILPFPDAAEDLDSDIGAEEDAEEVKALSADVERVGLLEELELLLFMFFTALIAALYSDRAFADD
jgi:hypothetical protein